MQTVVVAMCVWDLLKWCYHLIRHYKRRLGGSLCAFIFFSSGSQSSTHSRKRDDIPPEPVVGIATRIEARDGSTQTPPLLSKLTQGHLKGMDHGVRDPNCDHCKRALGPLYKHKIKSNRRLQVLTFDFSGPYPHRANVAQYLVVCVWSLADMRLVWAFGIEHRQSFTVLPCLQAASEDLRSLTGGSRPPFLQLHSDRAKDLLSDSYLLGRGSPSISKNGTSLRSILRS